DVSAMQNWRSEVDGDLALVVFDLLWYEGKSLMDLPFVERHAILKEVLPTDDDRIRLSEVFATSGIDFLEAATKIGLEGIMAKKASSPYQSNNRTRDWLKIKVQKRQEVVIGGFTKNENTTKQFSSLLLGVYDNGAFQYVGKVGTGFSDKLQKEMMAQFKPLITEKMPFNTEPDVNQPSRFRPNPPKARATWLKPELICEVSFTEITGDGVFRHPSFKGMRTDKSASEVVRETPVHTEDIVGSDETAAIEKDEKASTGKKGRDTKKSSDTGEGKKTQPALVKAPKPRFPKTLLNPNEQTQVKKIKGHELKFTNLSKVYWPEDGVTKRDMFNYYYAVSKFILPYLKNRPQSLNRFPNGIHGKSFYQKDVKGKAPEWVK